MSSSVCSPGHSEVRLLCTSAQEIYLVQAIPDIKSSQKQRTPPAEILRPVKFYGAIWLAVW